MTLEPEDRALILKYLGRVRMENVDNGDMGKLRVVEKKLEAA